MSFPHPMAGFYLEQGAAITDLARCSPPEACMGGSYGEASCAEGYTSARCSACLQGYYRAEQVCLECGAAIPLWVYLVAAGLAFVTLALAADRFLSTVKDVSKLMAPILVLMTFFQTLASLLQFDVSWPASIKSLMSSMAIVSCKLHTRHTPTPRVVIWMIDFLQLRNSVSHTAMLQLTLRLETRNAQWMARGMQMLN